MEVVYFSLTAILLYLAADFVLRRIEAQAGGPLAYRSLVFFAVLLALALGTFALIRQIG